MLLTRCVLVSPPVAPVNATFAVDGNTTARLNTGEPSTLTDNVPAEYRTTNRCSPLLRNAGTAVEVCNIPDALLNNPT